MSEYKEIVTKAVIGKGKKTFKDKYNLKIEDNVDTVLGCWVINHNLKGYNNNGSVLIKGSFDVNVWYSYNNNTKTNVAISKIDYEENVRVRLKDTGTLSDNSEIIIRSLRNPNCTDVKINNNIVTYEIEKELGIEIVGDVKVRVITDSNEDDYDIIEDEVDSNKVNNEIDETVIEEFLEK